MHKLTEDDEYHDVNHILHTDNWYTSIEMCLLCSGRKIDTIGTVKVNRKGLPRDGIFPKTGAGKQPKGSVKCMLNPGEDVFFTAWQDNKPVHMLSTIKPRLQRIMRKSATLGWKKAEMPSHSLIPAYNFGMGGTDRMDQLNSYYKFNHKGIRWTMRLFTHFLGVSVVNANILYNASNPDSRMNSHQFFDETITALVDLEKNYNWDDLEEEMAENPVLPVVNEPAPLAQEEGDDPAHPPVVRFKAKGKSYNRYRMTNFEIEGDRLEGVHVPIIVSNDKRRKCVFHPKTKSRYLCEQCDVALCLTKCGEESCWFKFHHMETWTEK